MSITFLGLPNIGRRGSTSIISIGPEPFVGEALNLKTDDILYSARITTVDPPLAKWQVFSNGITFDFDGIALVNNNLSNRGYFRIVNAAHIYVVLFPLAIISSGNITGTVGDIENEISNPNGLYVGPTTPTTDWFFTVSFVSSAEVPKTGEAMGIIAVSVEKFGSESLDVYPAIKVELRDNGNLIQNMGYRAVTTETTQIFLFTFDPAIMADPTLTNIEAKVYGYAGDNGSYFKVETINVYYEDENQSFTLDSGWISADQGQFMSIKDGLLPTKSVHYLAPSQVTNQSGFYVMFIDDGSEYNPPTGDALHINAVSLHGLSQKPQGFIEVGSMVFGPRLTFSPGILAETGNPKLSINVESSGGVGQVPNIYSADIFFQKETPSAIELICSRDIMMELMGKIGYQKGRSGLFYAILESDLALEYQLFSSFPCVCAEISSNPLEGVARTGRNNRGNDTFLVTIRLVEKV